MGQYYHPIILGKNGGIKGYWYSHKIGQGLKLMEHSYINNSLCNCVENYLIKNNGARVVWAGDYADPEKVKLTKAEAQEIWKAQVNAGKVVCSFKAFWHSNAPELYKPETDEDENLYSLCGSKTIELPDGKEKVVRKAKKELEYDTEGNEYGLLVNDDKKEFVNLWWLPSVGGMRINPLPLLTCEGNQRGGGDYYGLDEKLVGSWARNYIRLLRGDWGTKDALIKQGYTEITPTFAEGYEIKSDLKRTVDLLIKALSDEGRYACDATYVADVRYALEKLKKAMPRKTAAEKKILIQMAEKEAKANANNG